jgi:hypothetical protein
MPDREYWTRQLEDAKRELEAATKRSEVNAAAKRVMLANAELKRLQRKTPTGPASGVVVTAASA